MNSFKWTGHQPKITETVPGFRLRNNLRAAGRGLQIVWSDPNFPAACGLQIAIRDEQTFKWSYYLAKRTPARFAPDEAFVLIKARLLVEGDGGAWLAGPWSDVEPAARRDEDWTVGGGAWEFHPTRSAFYLNSALITQEIQAGSSQLESLPIQVSLILEGRGCNLKCFYCSHVIPGRAHTLVKSRVMTKGFSFGETAEIPVPYIAGRTIGTSNALIESIKANVNVFQTMMFGGSEPLLYPEFREVVTLASQLPDLRLSVCTNGHLIDEDIAEKLTAGNFSWVRISIDGATEDTYRRVRKGDMTALLANVRRLVQLRGDLSSPRIQFNFVCCRSNWFEMTALVRLAAELGVDAVNLKMLVVRRKPDGTDPFERPLQEEDPLSDEALCIAILDEMEHAQVEAARLGVMMTAEAVSPAIYSAFPHLVDRRGRDERQALLGAPEGAPNAAGFDGPMALADWARKAFGLEAVKAQPSRTLGWHSEARDGTCAIEFCRDGGAQMAALRIDRLDAGESLYFAPPSWRYRFAIDLPPGRYEAWIRPRMPGMPDRMQGPWDGPTAFQVRSDLSVSNGSGETLGSGVSAYILDPVDADLLDQWNTGLNWEDTAIQVEEMDSGDDVESADDLDTIGDSDDWDAVPTENADNGIDWPRVFCHQPFTNVSVGHNKIHFCCYARGQFNHARYAGEDLTLRDLWNHPVLVEARKLMHARRADLVCKPTCPHVRRGGLRSVYVTEKGNNVKEGAANVPAARSWRLGEP